MRNILRTSNKFQVFKKKKKKFQVRSKIGNYRCQKMSSRSLISRKLVRDRFVVLSFHFENYPLYDNKEVSYFNER